MDRGGDVMACIRDDFSFSILLIMTIEPGNGATSVIECNGAGETSPRIIVEPNGTVVCRFPLLVYYTIDLENDFRMSAKVTDVTFMTS